MLFALLASIPFAYTPSEPAPKPPTQFHEAPYKAGWDIDLSPYTGGEDLLFFHRAFERLEGWTFRNTPLRYDKKASARFWRLSELVAVWLPLNDLAIVVQHEVFGHGYRIRDLGSSKSVVVGYRIETPFPYGDGGGATFYDTTDSFTTTDRATVAMAGVEATAILAQITKFHWLQAGAVDPRQSFLYLGSLYDLPLYVSSLSSHGNTDGHDLSSYVRAVNATYTDGHLTNSELRALAWINFADPYTYYALYAWGRYIACGKETRIPMIRFGAWKYLPSVRLGLTPFGPEVFLQGDLVNDKRPLTFYLKAGNHADNTYLGAGLYAPTLYAHQRWSMGVRLDLWHQPKLLLLETDTEAHAMRLGGAGSVVAAYQGAPRTSLEIELGYKAQGFLPGNALRAAPILRGYCAFIF